MTANDVNAALAAPLDEVGARLAAIAEDQWFERKSIRIHAKDLGRPLVALANAEGGVIVVGIAAGQVEGLRNHLGKLNEFRQAPWTSPSLRCGLASIKSGAATRKARRTVCW